MSITITRVWAMPNKWTFMVHPLRDILTRYRDLNPGSWIDPFAGFNSPAEITNDLNPSAPTIYHLEAYEFCQSLNPFVDGAVFDPPYSLTQVSRSYTELGKPFHSKENPTGGFPKVKDEISRLVKPGGYAISYGWNTVGMGLKRGFIPVEYLICSHGGNRNDTLVTVEQRSA